MKNLVRVLMLTLLLSIALNSYSQKSQNEVTDIAMFSKVIKERSLFPDFNQAADMAKDARARLIEGNFKLADSLIKKSIALYPTDEVFEYALVQGNLPDRLGANLIMDLAIERVRNFPDKKVKIREPIGSRYENEKIVQVVVETDRARAHFHFISDALDINMALGERKWISYSLERADQPIITPLNKKKEYDYEVSAQQSMLLSRAEFKMDWELAEKIIESRDINKVYTKDNKALQLLFNKIQKEFGKGITEDNYKQVLGYIGQIPIEFVQLIYIINGHLEFGNIPEAEKSISNLPAKYLSIPFAYRMKASLDFLKKDYRSALLNLKKSSQPPEDKSLLDFPIDKWDLYTMYGEIYTELGDYEKAKTNFDIALLYYPEYKPAIKGLTELEVKHATVVAQDKTAPEITITEPANRGLKVVSAGQTVMIKGLAADQSGVKEVLINDQKTFLQLTGNFWGEIPLSPGTNKITITATDVSGNKSEKIIEIEKPDVAPNTEIVAVTERQGKNYCLLIATQNYTDQGIPSLDNPIADAVKLKIILKNSYNFANENIFSLFNPSNDELRRKLLELTTELLPEDNLVIFYAGHGLWVEKEKKGYWLMADAKYKDANTWLPNKTVLDLISNIPSRNTLLITDACFSGSVFKTRSIPANAPEAIKELSSRISRVAITSGNDSEVPDESVFMKYLIKALTENKEKYLTAQNMFINQIIEAVMTETKTEPRYGTLELAGHVGGDFVFSKK